MVVKRRNLLVMLILLIVTFGIYYLVWAIKTKNELVRLGNEVPSGVLLFIPFAHLYFWYRYSQAFARSIARDDNEVIYFLLIAFLPVPGMFILQDKFNQFALRHS